MQRIVRKDLELRSYTLKPTQLLTTAHKTERVRRGKLLRRLIAAAGADFVLYTDEKRFSIQQAYNHQNSRILAGTGSGARANPAGQVMRQQKPASLMAWAGVSAVGRTDLVFFDDQVRLNAQSYIDKVLEPQVRNAHNNVFGGQPFLFTQDGASCHTANLTQTWLQNSGINFVDKDGWPPHSPDLNPLDYSVWTYLEQKALETPAPSIAALKYRLKKAWREIPQEMLRNCCRSVPKRIKLMLDAQGGSFEK